MLRPDLFISGIARFVFICTLLICTAACQNQAGVETGRADISDSPPSVTAPTPAPEPTINPELSREAELLEFSGKPQTAVNEALRLAAIDSVSAHLTFKEISTLKDEDLSQAQRYWLKKQATRLKSEALAKLQQDYEVAAQILDLRGMALAMVVANRIKPKSLNDKSMPLKEATGRILSGALPANPVWRVTNVSGKQLESPYEEGESHSGILTIRSSRDTAILRVTARVENISTVSDKAYALWGLGEYKRSFAGMLPSNKGTATTTFLWLDDEWIWLTAGPNEIFPCRHVCKGSAMRETSIMISGPDGSAKVIAIPKAVKQGEAVDIDVLFTVPLGPRRYQLLIFGAAPAQVDLGPEAR